MPSNQFGEWVIKFATADLEKTPGQLDHYMVEGIVIIEKRNKV